MSSSRLLCHGSSLASIVANAGRLQSRCRISIRHLVYIKDGTQRARGLKKSESDYLTVNGVLYPGDDTTLEPVKSLLGEEFVLPDSLALQAITHKSFAHGKKPYNEKLAILGREFLKMHTSEFAVSHETQNPAQINHKNFDILPQALEILSSSSVTSEVCKLSGIAKNIFWKNRSENLAEKDSGAPTVYSKTIFALVGAILLRHGQTKAEAFVNEKLLKGPYSVVPISQRLFRA